jgi:hypothetical protein
MRSYLKEIVAVPVYKTEINGCEGTAALTTPALSSQKLALNLPTSGVRSVGIVRLWIKGHGVCLFVCLFVCECLFKILAAVQFDLEYSTLAVGEDITNEKSSYEACKIEENGYECSLFSLF